MGYDDFYKWNVPPPPFRLPIPSEAQWTLVKASRRCNCELEFQGESYGWECQLFEDRELRFGWRFPFHAEALAESAVQRARLLGEGWRDPL